MAKRQVLVVTNEVQHVGALVGALDAAGFNAVITTKLFGDLSPDLAVVDLSSGDLWSVAERLAGSPLLLVVADAEGLRRGYAMGAEDCVLVDTDPSEIVARCEAVLRRTASAPQGALTGEPAIYADHRLWVNYNSRQVWVADRPASLTPREFRLLEFLIQHRNQTLGHEDILTAVWERPPESDRPTEVLKQYVWRLRQKIEENPDEPATIVTDSGTGYRFVSSVA